jgi:cyanophycinase
MSIFLVGGGPDTLTTPLVWDQFLMEVRDGAAAEKRQPRIVVVLFDHEGSAEHYLPAYSSPLIAGLSCQVMALRVRTDEQIAAANFDDADGIVVGGGPTPEYHRGLQDAASTISNAVAGGVPYLGFSAGAMVAASTALIGGHLMDGREVCTEEWSEGLDDVTFLPGLGLIPFAVDVHASQAGTLGRAISAVHSRLVDGAVAIDEDTALVVQPGRQHTIRVMGKGHAWVVEREGEQTTISMMAGN